MKRMKKAISLLAAAVLVFALAVPVNASTDTDVPDTSETEVTKVSTETELAEAIATGGNIQLDGNVTLTDGLTVASGVEVVLDLNGFTISQEKAQTTAYAMIANKGDLTIIDSSENQTGVIRYADITSYTADNNHASNTIQNQAVLTIKGGTIENVSSDNVADYGYPHAIDVYQGSTTNISGGTVKSANYDSIRMFCNSTTEATTLNITGGTIINRISFQVPNAKAANGVLNISGGSFITTDNISANVRLLAFGSDLSNMKATISGGTFDKGVRISNYSGGELTWTPVTGGNFVQDVSAFVAEGYDCDKQSNGTYAVGLPLKNIIDNAADGSTITLDRDYTVDEIIYINKNLTIDGNGHVITSTGAKTFRINADASGTAPVTSEIKVVFRDVDMTNAVSAGRLIETRGGFVDLTLDNVSLITTGSNSQPYTAGGNHAKPISVAIKDSTLDAGDSGYCIITFNPVNLTVENSMLSGYSTLYFKGESSSAGSAGTVADIIGGTISHGAGVANEGFGVAVFEDDNVTLNIKDSTINATGVETSAYKAFCFSWRDYVYPVDSEVAVENNIVSITGASIINISETGATIERCVDENVTSNKVIFDGGKCNVDPSDYLKAGYGVYEDTEGMYVVCDHADTTVTDEAVAPKCEETGLTEGSHCEACGKVLVDQEEVPALVHSYKGVVTTEPTCIAKGEKTFTCENGCGSSYTEEVAMVEHTYATEFTVDKEATCTEKGSKSKHCTTKDCTAVSEVTEIPAHGHAYDDGVITTPATCIKEGVKTYTCTVDGCGATKTETVAKADHVFADTYTVDKASTCTVKGIESKHCTQDGCTAKTGEREIALAAHTEVIDKAVAPTCTVTGLTEGKHCDVCDAVLVKQEVVPATGHNYATQSVKETCTTKGYTTYTCSCGDTYTADEVAATGHTEVVDAAVAPTCQKTGLTEGSHCGVCGEVLVAQKEVAKVEHKYSAYAYNDDATCTEDGTETAVCDFGCGAESTLVAEGTALGHTEVIDEVVAPTCQKTGLTEGKHCSVCDEVLVAQEVVPVVEHKYTTYAYNNDATCTKDGTETAKCDFGCGAVSILTKEGSALGHTEVIDKGVAATCTATGITEGKHCSVCDEVLVAQKELPALGHDYVKGVCTRCNSIIEVVGDTTQSVTKEEVTTDKKEEVVVKEVTIIEDTNTEAAKEIVKTEANTIVADIVTEVVVAEKPVEELQIVKDEVISVETAQKVIKAIEEGKTDFETEIVVEEAAPELIEKAVAQNIEKKAEATLGADAKVAQYLDVSVLLKCAETGDTLGTIDKLNEEIVVTIAIPENLKADGRTYIVIREHNGVIENIPTVVNKDGTISFKTGKFSTYALAYTDTGVSAPKTNDMPLAAPIVGICVAGIVLVAVVTRRKSFVR